MKTKKEITELLSNPISKKELKDTLESNLKYFDDSEFKLAVRILFELTVVLKESNNLEGGNALYF
jgi:hypothetical protein